VRKPLLILAFLILSACSGLPFLPTATPGSSGPPPTDTQPPTPLPPQLLAREYLDAWKPAIPPSCILADADQPEYSLETFTTIRCLPARVANQCITILSPSPRGARGRLPGELETILVGTITRETVMEMSLEDGLWRIRWDRSLILPELRGDNTLAMTYAIPSRGNIYDREGKALVAGETNAVSIGLIAGETDPEQEADLFYTLWLLTGLEPSEIGAVLAAAPAGGYVPLAEAPAASVEAQFDLLESFDGLAMSPYISRYYFGGGIAPQAIGYVSLIQPEEADTYQRLGYRVDERIGRIGLEKWGEPYLAGTRGGSLHVVSPDGHPITLLAETSALPSSSLYTTIDKNLQTQLQQAVQGFTGAVVVLERDTGRILALVSSPGYDPNLFEPSNFNSDYLLSDLLTDPRTPLLNRATQGQYPLGSVFKIITMSAALESGQYTPESSYYCGSYFTEIEGLTRADWTVSYQAPPSGQLDLREGLMRSCNPWFWHIGLDFYDRGLDTLIAEWPGRPGARPVAPASEAAGNIPPQNRIDATNLAIGQGDLVTPLQACHRAIGTAQPAAQTSARRGRWAGDLCLQGRAGGRTAGQRRCPGRPARGPGLGREQPPRHGLFRFQRPGNPGLRQDRHGRSAARRSACLVRRLHPGGRSGKTGYRHRGRARARRRRLPGGSAALPPGG
jgi:penicillin-binding protein 2